MQTQPNRKSAPRHATAQHPPPSSPFALSEVEGPLISAVENPQSPMSQCDPVWPDTPNVTDVTLL